MRRLRGWLLRVGGLLRGERHARELEEELECHVALHAADNVRAGMDPREARRQALLRLGGVEPVKERVRDQQGVPSVESLLRDVRAGVRTLRRSPAFTVVAVLTLALGIGANVAIFSVVDAVLLKSLPYPEAERIVRISRGGPSFASFGGPEHFSVSPAELSDSDAFDALALFVAGRLNLGRESVEPLRAASVTEGFFDVLGTPAVIGRTFTADDLAQTRQVAVISHSLWQRRFLGDPSIVRRSIFLNGRPFFVTGVMPPRVEFPGSAEVWIPSGADARIGGRVFQATLVGRLGEGVGAVRARDEVAQIQRGTGISVETLRDTTVETLHDVLAGEARPVLLLIASGALLVLVVACANTTNLMLSRVATREREFAARRALGASQFRLVRQVLCESLVLAVLAGLAAAPAASWTLSTVRVLVPASLYGSADIALDIRALAATAALSLVTAFAFGLAPALSLRDRGRAWVAVLQGTPTGSGGPVWSRFRSVMVVAQIAVALVLLAGAVTIVRTVDQLMSVDLGVGGERSLVAELSLSGAGYESEVAAQQFHERLEEAVRGIRGVHAVGSTDVLPAKASGTLLAQRMEVAGETDSDGEPEYGNRLTATPGYFAAMGIDVLDGREFSPIDDARQPPVAIVSARYARAMGMRRSELVGRRVQVGGMGSSRWAEVVGVVDDVRLRGPRDEFRPAVYVPFAQRTAAYHDRIHLVVKAAGDPGALAPLIRNAVARLDPSVPLYEVRTFREIRASLFAQQRFAMTMMLGFAALAIGLAAVGLYGVVTYLVELRTREFGIRMVIGASPARVQREVMATGVRLALGGIVLGTASAMGLWRVAAAGVQGLSRLDQASFALMAGVVLVVAVTATWLPALRATRVDPVDALRRE